MEKLFISFSGGRSSFVMTDLLLSEQKPDREIAVAFCNTGLEHEATLDFVNDCDRHWGGVVVWLESVFHGVGKGVTHKIVDFNTASRRGEPFEAFIAKHGIPNATTPQCTARLKLDCIFSYRRANNWLACPTAIGIRADEIDRQSKHMERDNLIYPLIDRGFTKEMVNAYAAKFPFDLKIPNDAYGNCVTCWKKSDRKLFTIAIESPHYFDFFRRMDSEYGNFKTDCAAASPQGNRRFFRGHRTTQDILDQAHQTQFEPYSDEMQRTIWNELIDVGAACDQGCEVFHD